MLLPFACSVAVALVVGVAGVEDDLPLSVAPTSRASSGIALSGTVIMTTSPNDAASSGVPADARVPSSATIDCNSSGCRDENFTSCPASTHNFPTVDPIFPAPMIPILIVVIRPSVIRDP